MLKNFLDVPFVVTNQLVSSTEPIHVMVAKASFADQYAVVAFTVVCKYEFVEMGGIIGWELN